MTGEISSTALLSYKNSTINNVSERKLSGNDDKKLYEACQDFESIFIKQMFDAMRNTVVKTDLIKRNMGEDVFEDMLYDEYAKKMSRTSNLGLAEMMFKQLSGKTLS